MVLAVPAARLTLDELVDRLHFEITEAGLAPLNGQVQALPDRRTLRYYTTLGLLDRPSEMRGRQALYGSRHLLQALAIKRLQADGLGLAAIQRRLAGLPDDELQRVAYPDGATSTAALGGDAARPLPLSRAAFWTQPPAAAGGRRDPIDAAHASRPAPPESPAAQTTTAATGTEAPQLLAGVPLGAGVLLLFPSAHPLDPVDLEDMQAAAAPLLDHLRRSGALGPDGNHPGASRP